MTEAYKEFMKNFKQESLLDSVVNPEPEQNAVNTEINPEHIETLVNNTNRILEILTPLVEPQQEEDENKGVEESDDSNKQ